MNGFDRKSKTHSQEIMNFEAIFFYFCPKYFRNMQNINKNNPELFTIGDNLRLFRTAKKLTAEYVAKKLGISKSTYSEIENNQKRINLEMVKKIATIFEVPHQQLTNFVPQQIFQSVNNSQIASTIAEQNQYNHDERLLNMFMNYLKSRDEHFEKLIQSVIEILASLKKEK
jgi:transcriptional regulator with XRE-family HTH domain